MNRRLLAPLAAAVAVTIVATALSAPGASGVTVKDPVGDSQAAPDVTGLGLRQERSRIVYDVSITGRADRLAEGEYIVLFLDADNDDSTGGNGSGADYLIEFEQKGDGVLRVYRYDTIKKGFAFERGFNGSFRTLWGGRLDSPANVWRFYFTPRMFGIAGSFRVYARAESAGAGRAYTFDRVPDNGLATVPLGDAAAPTAKALPSKGKRGQVAKLMYRVADGSGRTREVVTVKRGATTLATVRTKLHPAVWGKTLTASWKVPVTRKGALRFCVRAFDRAGNSSAQSCARLIVR